MDKVWIVTSGEYSAYGIDRVFDNEQAAQDFIDTTRDRDGYAIEEYPVNHAFDRNRVFWMVSMWTNGDKSTMRYEELPPDVALNAVIEKDVARGIHLWRIWIQADREEKALKIGFDAIAQHRAMQAGIA